MSYNTILVEKDGPAMVVTLNRPESRNSFSVELMGELAAAAKEGQDDPDIFGIIVTGGDKYFASGADLNEALALAARRASSTTYRIGRSFAGQWKNSRSRSLLRLRASA